MMHGVEIWNLNVKLMSKLSSTEMNSTRSVNSKLINKTLDYEF